MKKYTVVVIKLGGVTYEYVTAASLDELLADAEKGHLPFHRDNIAFIFDGFADESVD